MSIGNTNEIVTLIEDLQDPRKARKLKAKVKQIVKPRSHLKQRPYPDEERLNRFTSPTNLWSIHLNIPIIVYGIDRDEALENLFNDIKEIVTQELNQRPTYHRLLHHSHLHHNQLRVVSTKKEFENIWDPGAMGLIPWGLPKKYEDFSIQEVIESLNELE
jgi:hypothetical protein